MESNENLCRKSTLKRLSNNLIQSPLRQSLLKNQQLDYNNDDKERSKQSGGTVLHRRLSEIPSKSSNLGRLFNELEAKEHFQNCQKLFSENKITTKNVWHMQIIDILSHVVQGKRQKNLLQFAGTSLDISAKVYGIRVDDVHSFGLKLATNLTKTEKHKNDDNNDDNSNDSDNDDQHNTKKKTTRKKLKKRFQHNGDKKLTIDDGALFAPLKKLQKPPFSIDNKVDAGAVDNLLTMRLPLNPMGHTFRIFNNETYQIKQRDTTVGNETIANIELSKFKNCKICPQFDDFIVNQFDANSKIQLNKSINSNSNSELIYDNNGLPIAELDGSVHDLFPVNDENDSINDGCDDVEEVVDHLTQQEQPNSGIFEIVNKIPLNELQENEYGYNSLIQTVSGKFIDKIWAGPAHWKIKYIRRANLKCSSNTTLNQQTGKTKHRKKVALIVDLNTSEDGIINYDLSKKIANKRKSSSTNYDKVTLPLLCAKLLDFNKRERELFLKSCTVGPLKRNENLEIKVETYNYNNQNDSLYCSQIDFDDNPNNEDDWGNDDDIEEQQANENFEQLIEAPEMVQVSYLKYALHAKKINIKKLKRSVWVVWEELTHKNNEEKTEPVCFSKVYKTLPEKLDTKTKQELSVALAFNSVLYLCNENCLNLVQTNYGNTDFEIIKV